MQKLFAAQRKHPHAEPILSSEPVHQEQQPHVAPVQKSTLHSFWKQLPAPPVHAPTAPMQHDQLAANGWNAPKCEDCDASLQSESGDMDMDIDMDGTSTSNGSVSPFACNDCGKNVCGTCAVAANARHCLSCATTERRSGRWW